MKIVIDTNLLVATSFNKNSFSAKLIQLAKRGKIDLMWSHAILKEANLILSNIGKAAGKKMIKLNQIFKDKNKTNKTPRVIVVREDPEDNKLISCALAAKANLLVSNDHHLLDLNGFRGLKITTPSKAYKIIINCI